MNIDELYSAQNVKKENVKTVSFPKLPGLKLPYEEIVPAIEPVPFELQKLQNLNEIITEEQTFQIDYLPAVIYERRHKPTLKPYPYTYHLFYCSHLKKYYSSMQDVQKNFLASIRTDGKLRILDKFNQDYTEVQHRICRDCYTQLARLVGYDRLERLCGKKQNFSLKAFYNAIKTGKISGIKGLESIDNFRPYRNEEIYYGKQYWSDYAYLRKAAEGFKCAKCGKVCCDAEGNYTGGLQVHHKDKNPMNMNPKDHVVLCEACHRAEHHGKIYEDID